MVALCAILSGPMGFEFIDSTGPVDPASRLRIRRQAALGKNLGRKLNRPSKKNATRVPQSVAKRARPGSSARQTHDQRDAVDEQLQTLPSPEHQVGNTLTQLQFRKIGPDGLVMNAISFILQAPRSQDHGIGKAVHTGKVPLFSSFMFQDEAYFHSTVAFSLRALSNRPDAHGLQSMLAIQHMARSLQLVNSRFGTAESISDINLAVVVVMTQYTRISGQMDECRIHLDGLERMVQLRGGINAIRPELAEKIFRVDLGCAYQLSAPTRFTIPELEQYSWSTIGPGGLISKAQREVTRSFVRPDLIAALSPIHEGIFLDATQLSCALDEAYSGNREWLTISELHQSTLYMGYRIVGAPQGTPNENSDVELLARLGLVTFCLSFFRSFDANIVKSSALGLAIGKVVQILRPRGAWTEELTLWTILMGHIVQIFGDDVWPHVTRRARLCIHNLNLTSWPAATKMLVRYPWTDALWGSNGKIMWDALMMLPEPADADIEFEVPIR